MTATRRLLVLALPPLLVAPPALASDKKTGKDDEAPASRPIELAPVAAPIIVGSQVKNYIFITVRLTPAAGADLKALRDKEALLRDAVVRVAHRTPFNRTDSYNAIDEGRARTALFAAFTPIVGRGQIKSVDIAVQLPKNLVRGPRP